MVLIGAGEFGNRNRAAIWVNFQVVPIRYDLLEMLVLEIDIPSLAMTQWSVHELNQHGLW